MSEIIEGNTYSYTQQQTAKSVIQGHYSFNKTFFFWGMIPFFLLSGALKLLQLDFLHNSLTQGEILNMMYFRVATLFILGCMVVYFILILAGLWRAAMRIKNETLRMTAKTITSLLAIIWLFMLVLLVKAQFEYLIESIKYSDYVTPKVYPIGVLVFLPYLFLFTDTQLVALGFTPANQAANKTQLSENGKLALLLILFFIAWILTIVFLPNAYEEDRYIFKGEPTFNLPTGYEQVTYSNNLQGYIRNKTNNLRETPTQNENEAKLTLENYLQLMKDGVNKSVPIQVDPITTLYGAKVNGRTFYYLYKLNIDYEPDQSSKDQFKRGKLKEICKTDVISKYIIQGAEFVYSYRNNQNNKIFELIADSNICKQTLLDNKQESLINSMNSNTEKDNSTLELNRVVAKQKQELPRCYSSIGNERIYHDFKKGECIDD